MAIIVNDRDVLLQSVSPRIQQVGLAPNVAIDPSQVPGLSAAFDATKEVALSSTSQVFVVPKVGAIQPAVITISATLRSITGTPTFSVIDGTVSFTNNGTSITVSALNMSSPTATIQVSVLFNSVLYTDKITLGKIAEGSDAVVGLLSNEACTVAADPTGNVTGAVLAASGGTYNIFDGIINMTGQASVVYSVLNTSGCTMSIAATGVYTLNSVTAATASATLRAVYTRGTASITVDKVYSVAKAVAGIIGSNAKLLYLTASSQIFQIPKAGSVTPAQITLTATAQNLDQSATYNWVTTPAMTLGGSGNVRTLNYSDMTADAVRVDATRDGMTDTITLVKVREGNDSITGYLTNEAALVPADSSGTVAGSSYAAAGGTFEVYQGLTHLTGIGPTYSVISETGIDVSINATTGVYTVNSMSTDAGVATLRASLTVGASTINIDKVYSLAKSKTGATGAGGSGTRGTVNIAGAISGSSWTDAAANSVLSGAGYGVPQSRDIVTLYNTSVSYSESKFYSGSAWIPLDAYINGNLLVAKTIASASINTGAIQTQHLSFASGGKNILNNSAPMPNATTSWTSAGYSNNGANPQPAAAYSAFGPIGAWAIGTHDPASPASGSVFGVTNDNNGAKYPVKAGQRYEFSAYLDIARAASAHVRIYWFNSSGSAVGESAGSLVTATSGKAALATFPRSTGFDVAPATAASCVFGVRLTANGSTDAYVFVSMAYMGEATSAQTDFSAWSEGGLTTIGPTSISTPNLSAISGDMGYLTVGHMHGPVISGGAYTDVFAYPAAGAGNGFHLSGNGLLMGNANTPGASYFRINVDGSIGSRQFNIDPTGNATFGGNLSAAGGSFSGTLSAASAQVDTLNINGNAVTVPEAVKHGLISGTGAGIDVLYVGITMSQPGSVLVSYSCSQGYSSGLKNYQFIIQYLPSGGAVVDVYNSGSAGVASAYQTMPCITAIVKNIPTGVATFRVVWYGQDGTVSIDQGTLSVIGAKR
jgi:hypothetical protein